MAAQPHPGTQAPAGPDPLASEEDPAQPARAKGNLRAVDETIVWLLIAVPLAMVMARLLALPGVAAGQWPVFRELAGLGEALNAAVTLQWVPAADRPKVSYLLLLPTATLLIVIARLTFGLRVLGFRSILVAVGFAEVGVWASLMVILLVVGTIVLLRPSMRRIRLPLYARTSLTLGLTACLTVGFLMVGAWQRSELVWSLAFFPIIILAMMAEAIAGTLDTHNPVTAAWRLGWTLVLAFILFFLMSTPAVPELLMRAPELMVLQLALIVVVSEFFDLRLLQDWQSQAHALALRVAPLLASSQLPRRRRVAIVRNRSHHGTIGRLGPEAHADDSMRSVQHLVDALRDRGYSVKVFEGDMTLLRELRKFLPPHPRTGAPGGVVLNVSAGIQGHGCQLHVPGMLEMAGIAYTGPDPNALARLSDRCMLLLALQHAGLRAPAFRMLDRSDRPADAFPLIVGPRYDKHHMAVVVRTNRALAAAVARFISHGLTHLVCEQAVEGEEFVAMVVGNRELRCLPLLRKADARAASECPARIENDLAERIRHVAMQAYRAAGCRDYACITICLPADGEPWVTDVRVQDILGRRSAAGTIAAAAGIHWGGLVSDVVELAAYRNEVEWTQAAEEGELQPSPGNPPAAIGGTAS